MTLMRCLFLGQRKTNSSLQSIILKNYTIKKRPAIMAVSKSSHLQVSSPNVPSIEIVIDNCQQGIKYSKSFPREYLLTKILKGIPSKNLRLLLNKGSIATETLIGAMTRKFMTKLRQSIGIWLRTN